MVVAESRGKVKARYGFLGEEHPRAVNRKRTASRLGRGSVLQL